ncbi:unnamed protein product [Lathyrus sativus]|nr:unnamed protein product [Lathyrus sativus]
MKMMNAEYESHAHKTKGKSMTKEEFEAGKRIMGMLKKADMNKDGCYTKDEIKQALKSLGAYFPGWKAESCLQKLDGNNDGKISGDEIDDLINHLLDQGFGKK